MKKIIMPFTKRFAWLAIALLSISAFGQTAAEWQSISLGTVMSVDCPSKKVTSRSGKNARKDSYNSLVVIINVKNGQTKPTFYDLEVFFISKSMIASTMPEGDQARDKQSAQFSLDANSSTNLPFHASLKIGRETFDCGWTGYIVRLSAFGKPIKTVASSKALEHLANDPEKMKLLETGKIVPAK